MVGKSEVANKTAKKDEDKRGRGRPNRSPARSSGDTRKKSKSPARSKAAASSPKKAPKTPPRSPRKKSPARASPSRKVAPRPKSPARKAKDAAAKKFVESVVVDSDSESESRLSVQTRSRTTISKEGSIEPTNNAIRTRLRSRLEPVVQLTQFSDEDEVALKGKYPTKASKLKQSYLKLLCVLSTVLLELLIIATIVALCLDRHCIYRLPTFADYKKLLGLFDVNITLILTAYFAAHALLSIIPIGGKRVQGMVYYYERNEYITNGLAVLVLNLLAFIALEVYHVPAANFILSNLNKFIASSFVLSAVLGVFLYAKASMDNPMKLDASVKDNTRIVTLILGSEVNPRLFGMIDWKFLAFRFCSIVSVLVTVSALYLSLEIVHGDPKKETVLGLQLLNTIKVKPSIMVFSGMALIYASDAVNFESTLLSSMEFKTATFGFRSLYQYLTGGLLRAAMAKVVLDSRHELENWHLALSTVLFVFGYILYRGSTSQKHSFRENPYSPKVANLDTIPTSSGKKLLCSSYWGLVRHPNYLGNICAILAMTQFVLCTPYSALSATMILNLIGRAYGDNKRCKERYSSAWDRYCSRVKYILVPKIF